MPKLIGNNRTRLDFLLGTVPIAIGIRLLYSEDVIFYQHSRAMVAKDGEIWVQNVKFAGKRKSLKEFIMKTIVLVLNLLEFSI